ncbi:hypothetical protein GCM10022248_71780 [Nonomuraea soli]
MMRRRGRSFGQFTGMEAQTEVGREEALVRREGLRRVVRERVGAGARGCGSAWVRRGPGRVVWV